MPKSAIRCWLTKKQNLQPQKKLSKLRYEKEAEAEEANVKALAEMQTKELEEVSEEFDELQESARSLLKTLYLFS